MSVKWTYDELLQRVKVLEEEKKRWRTASSFAESPDGQVEAFMRDKSLGSIIDVEKLQEIMDDFYQLTGMVTAILDIHGTVIEATGWQDICTKFHRVHETTAENCRNSDLFLVQNVMPGKYIEYKCKNGLRDLVTPLYIGNRHMGNIYSGQFFYDDEDVDEGKFIEQAEKYGFAKDAYLEALYKVPRYSRDVIHALMCFLVKFSSYISHVSYAKMKLEREIFERKRIERAVQKSERFLAAIIENIPHMIFVKDAKDFRYVTFNRAGEELLGYFRDELIGKSDYDFFRKEEADFFNKKDREVIERKVLSDIQEETIGTRHKGDRILHTKKIPIFDEMGNPEYLLGISEDITEQKDAEKALRESEERFRSIFDNSDVGILVSDIEGEKFFLANDAQCRMLGYERNDLLRLGVGDIHPKEDLVMVRESFQRHVRGEPAGKDVPLLRADGTVFYADVTASPMILDGRKCIVGLFTDVSKRRSVEKELEQYRDHLEELVRDRTGELEKSNLSLELAKKEAETANRAKSEFLSSVGHEIRTPMNTIMGMTYLVLKTDLTVKQQEYLCKIQKSSRDLLHIINDILDFSNIETGRLCIDTVSFLFDDVLQNLAQQFGPQAEKKGLELLFDIDKTIPAKIVGDPVRLRQILFNLCTNAIKFTEHGGICVSACRVEKDGVGGYVRFYVCDTGIGLSLAQQAKLFQSFSQGDASTTRRHGGIGLGLALCKQLVLLMGGDIGVVSEPGCGSTFWFEIPFAAPEKSVEESKEPSFHATDMALFAGQYAEDRDQLENCEKREEERCDVASHEELIVAIKALMHPLHGQRPRLAKECMLQIYDLVWPAALTDALRSMEHLIATYQFKDAMTVAESILCRLERDIEQNP